MSNVQKKILKAIRENDLYAWVFTTGAIILIIEIVAVRILAPFFGNTLFSVSSVLSVVLLALSVGYWVGGNVSDKHPKREVFYSIIAASGILLLFLEAVRTSILEQISETFTIVTGPLISAIILFIGPAFLLGMLSPFAIKLKTVENKKVGIGHVTGGMFFWSTLGSITGSIMAGFVLIPLLGVNTIMLSIGIILVAMGTTPLILNRVIKGKSVLVLIGLVGVLAAAVMASRPALGSNVLYQADGLYERITITEGTFRGEPTRFLLQDRSNSGAAFLESDELVYDYTKYYSVYKAFDTSLENALVLGGGAYSIPKAIHDEPEQPIVDVVEIEPDLYELSQIYFDAPVSDRMHNFVEDGRRFLLRTDKKYDLIYGDVYKSLFSIPTHFTTKEFFELTKSRMTDDGVFVVNVIGDTHRVDDSFIFAEMKTFMEVFPNSHFYATRDITAPGVQNLVFVGAQGDEKTEIDYNALRSSDDPTLASLGQQELDPQRFPLSSQIVLTDNFAPVDFKISKMLNRSRGDTPTAGEQAMSIVEQLLNYGPRYSGSPGSREAFEFIRSELQAQTAVVAWQEWEELGVEYANVMGRFAPEKERRLILGTHFDSKKRANLDARNPDAPVPGANDSSSGVAALLMVASELHLMQENWPYDFGVDLIFFDGEEGPESVDDDPSLWKPVGSTYFARTMNQVYQGGQPEAAVILDMVCERDAVFKKEPSSVNSAPELVDAFWESGKLFDADMFSDLEGPGIRDDHTPLIQAGIPAMLVIDFDYPPFHTTEDTLDKCSGDTLQTVIASTLHFIQNYDN